MPAFRRRRKLPKRRLQLKLTFIFAGLVVLGLTMQHLLFVKEMTMLAEELPNDGAHVVESVNQLTLTALLATVACIVPITLVVGVLTTFRIAGPIFRLERHLGAIARGEDPGACRLRKGDELKELCGAVNPAVRLGRSDRARTGLDDGRRARRLGPRLTGGAVRCR
jgi:hypothetical protein